MMKNLIKFFTLFSFLNIFGSQALFANVSLSKSTIYKNQATEITFTLSDLDNYKVKHIPKIKNLNISGPSEQRFYNFINGKTSSGHKLVFTIHANKPGNYIITPIELSINGKSIKSETYNIKVLSGSMPGRQSMFFKQQGSGSGKLVLYPKKAYVGEVVTGYYKIKTENFSYPFMKVETTPEFPNLFSSLFEDKTEISYQGSDEFKTFTGNQQLFLVALKSGKQTLSEHTILIGDQANRTDAIRVFIPSLKTTILPLPKKGQPKNFSGNVGLFKITWRYKDDQSGSANSVDKEFVIKLMVSGKGNFVHFSVPNLIYDKNKFNLIEKNEIERKYNADAKNPFGSIIIEYKLLPLLKGQHSPGKITTNWFDNYSNKYQSFNLDFPVIDFKESKIKLQKEQYYFADEKSEISWPLVSSLLASSILFFMLIYFRDKVIPYQIREFFHHKFNHFANLLFKIQNQKEVFAKENRQFFELLNHIRGNKRGVLCQEYLQTKNINFQDVKRFMSICEHFDNNIEHANEKLYSDDEMKFISSLEHRVR